MAAQLPLSSPSSSSSSSSSLSSQQSNGWTYKRKWSLTDAVLLATYADHLQAEQQGNNAVAGSPVASSSSKQPQPQLWGAYHRDVPPTRPVHGLDDFGPDCCECCYAHAEVAHCASHGHSAKRRCMPGGKSAKPTKLTIRPGMVTMNRRRKARAHVNMVPVHHKAAPSTPPPSMLPTPDPTPQTTPTKSAFTAAPLAPPPPGMLPTSDSTPQTTPTKNASMAAQQAQPWTTRAVGLGMNTNTDTIHVGVTPEEIEELLAYVGSLTAANLH